MNYISLGLEKTAPIFLLLGLGTAISPPPGGGALQHSWFVKGIGIKTKTSVVQSQVNSDTGDVP